MLVGGGGWNGMRSLIGVAGMNGDAVPDLIAVVKSTGEMYLCPGKASGLGTRTKQGSGWNG